jgi:hypothetical protein
MFYSGGTTFHWRMGYAWSLDGSNWTKYNDPSTTIPWLSISDFVLDWGASGSFDDGMASDGSVYFNTQNNTLELWYTGRNDAAMSTAIGYASAPFDTSFLSDIHKTSQIFPSDFVLKQNYPNPFNPSTTIQFDLPKTSEVTLKVFSILGEEVATLLSVSLLSGSHSVEWDAGHLASGVYLYRLVANPSLTGEAGGFVETRKMMLIK